MDQQTEKIYEFFQSLLASLDLPENIFGYMACVLLMTIILTVKTIVLSCVYKKLRHCVTTPAEFSCDELELV